MWRVSLVSSAAARPLTRTIFATRNPRGLSLKVSDEFTVPLCAIHHNQIHTTLKEQDWWQERKIDPLKIVGELWRQSRDRLPGGNVTQTDIREAPVNEGTQPAS